jgi:hypothetical protein
MAPNDSTTKVQTVLVSIHNPSTRYPQGVSARGCYVVDAKGLLTMTDGEGKPVLDDDGLGYKHQLQEGENPKVIAGRLTKKLRDALSGKSGRVGGFSGPIPYQRTGWL